MNMTVRPADIMRQCKRCDRELCQPYCEPCGVHTRTEAEETADSAAIDFERAKADTRRFVAMLDECFPKALAY
jgi:hypothetical protein